jgi:hypothetical protein
MINLFNWVTLLVESFTFYGGGKGGGGSSQQSTSQAVDFFGVDKRQKYEDMLYKYVSGDAETLANVKNEPGYKFGFDMGLEALNRNFASTGVGPTGYQNIALQNYGQGYAQNYINNKIGSLTAPSGAGISLGQNSTTTSSSQNASPLWNVAGTVAGAMPWGSIFSDKNLKTNIKYIKTIKGIKIYSFNYIWSHVKSIGVLAQDLLKMPEYKHTVSLTSLGYTVDYSKLPI